MIDWREVGGTATGFLSFATNPENSFEVPTGEVLQSGISSRWLPGMIDYG